MMRRDTRILFFTAGVVPSDDETELAYKLSNNIGFRNGSQSAAGAVEHADGVAALDVETIPGNYSEAYTTVTSKADVDKLDKDIAAADKAGKARPVGTGPKAHDNAPSGPGSRRGKPREPAAPDTAPAAVGGPPAPETPATQASATPPATPAVGGPPATGGWNPNN